MSTTRGLTRAERVRLRWTHDGMKRLASRLTWWHKQPIEIAIQRLILLLGPDGDARSPADHSARVSEQDLNAVARRIKSARGA
jgi:hypothetical protein